MIQKLRQMLKFSDIKVKGHGQGRKVKTFGMSRKASSQGMCMWNMKVLPLMVQKLWQMLKFSDM